jgi:hypothetical protein
MAPSFLGMYSLFIRFIGLAIELGRMTIPSTEVPDSRHDGPRLDEPTVILGQNWAGVLIQIGRTSRVLPEKL